MSHHAWLLLIVSGESLFFMTVLGLMVWKGKL